MVKVKLLTELEDATDLELTKKAYTTPLAPKEGKDGIKAKQQEQPFPAGPSNPKREPCSRCGLTLDGPPVETNPRSALAQNTCSSYPKINKRSSSCRYVQLQMTLATFKHLISHPAHFTLSLTDSTSIHAIGQHIRQHLDNAVTSVAVFSDASCSRQTLLNPSKTLEDYKIVGGARHDPAYQQLFYDYIPEFTDCPILMADNAMRNVHIPAQVKPWRHIL